MPEAYTVTRDAPLGELNTLRVAATASRLVTVNDPEALPAALSSPDLRERPVLVLGEGSNVLFASDFDGVVLRPAWRAVDIASDDGPARSRIKKYLSREGENVKRPLPGNFPDCTILSCKNMI